MRLPLFADLMPLSLATLSHIPASSLIDAAVARTIKLAPLPGTAQRLLRLANHPAAPIDDVELSRALHADPSLVERVLTIANSGCCRRSEPVLTLTNAFSQLGSDAVLNFAIAASLGRMFRLTGTSVGFDPRDLFVHAVAVAAGAYIIAANTNDVAPSDAFLAGFVHDIGLVVELQVCRELFLATIAESTAHPCRSFRDVESEIIGANHEAFGDALCRAWQFPPSLQRISGHHHDPFVVSLEDRRLATIIRVADHLAARTGLGCSRIIDGGDIEAELLDDVRLSENDLAALCATLPDYVNELMPMLSGAE